jgi:hypothetical protein
MEGNAKLVILKHLGEDLKEVFMNAVKNNPAHTKYTAVLRALWLVDVTLGLELKAS